MNPHIPITQRFIFDPLPLANMLEEMFGQYLLPVEPGYYIKGNVKPIMVPGKFYFTVVGSNNDVALKKAIIGIDDIDNDVYNEQGDVIIPKKAKRLILTKPDVPVRGIKIIESLVDKIIIDRSSKWMHRNPYSVEEMLNEFVLPQYRFDKNNPAIANLFDRISNMLVDVRTDVNAFIGVDDWIMHFYKLVGTDIIIEKSTDYRIYDWARRMENGEWI